jgi:iron complex outermembrane receptor protein
MHPARSTLALAAFCLASPVLAQSGRGTVRGIVVDSVGRGLSRVQVSIGGTQLGLFTSDSGRFMIRGIPLGPALVHARHVGFEPDSQRVRVADLDTTNVTIVLQSRVVVLDAESITADPTRGKMGPFNQRRSRGVGSFITRAEIEKRQAGSVSELLRYLPGVGVSQRMAGEPQPVHMQRSVNTTTTGKCEVLIYVDGHPYQNGNLDDFSPNSLEGIEVYRSASEIPAAFRARDATCGVIALWTRDPESARQKP